MELSMYLAQIMGLVFLVFAVGLLFNKAFYQKLVGETATNHHILLVSGYLNLVLGLLMVLKHNMWEAGYVGLVTLIAWIVLLKGLFLLLFPTAMSKMIGNMKTDGMYWLGVVVSAVLGLYLSYVGFFA